MVTNALLTPSVITKETLVILENNLVAAGKVNRQFENQFVKIGNAITVRKPNRFLVTKGPGLVLQNISEPSTSLTISTQAHVDFQFSSTDLTLTIEEFAERYLKPAAAELANTLDFDVLTNIFSFSNLVGTAGTVPSNFAALAAVGQRMDELAAPQEGRVLVLNPAAYWGLSNGLIGLFVTSVSEPALKGFLANIANFSIYMDQNIQAHTWGNFAGAGVVNGAGQTGSQIVTNGWTPSIGTLFNAGDVVTFAGVFQVNPKNRQSTGSLANFQITSAVGSDSGGNAILSIFPAITTSGAFQNSSASPANLASVSPATAPSAGQTCFNNFGFTRDAIGLVTVPMELPEGVDFRSREMWKGISLRIIRAYDVNSDNFPCRTDLLYGSSPFYNDLGVRLTN
jgi:P22 coat protein - gene protein 5